MIRFRYSLLIAVFAISTIQSVVAEPLPIDPLWKSELFRKTITGSFGIDSRIEPLITTDEEFYLDKSAGEMAANDRDAAIKTLSECSILDQSPALLFSLATMQFEAGELEVAATRFEEAIDQFPNFRDAHRNLAVVKVQKDDFDGATEHLVRAMELGSRDSLTMGLLGYCHSIKDHHQAALDAYRLAALTQPAERQWKVGEAQALQALNRPREAASIYQQLIEQRPDELNIWLVQADNWIALDRPIDAIANLELNLRAKSLTSEATVSLGHLYLQNDLPELALDRYESALSHESPPPLGRVVEALELLGHNSQWDLASRFATSIESSSFHQEQLNTPTAELPILSRYHRQKALIELETGDAEAGAQLVTDWLAREPLDGLALILLARFKEDSHDREEAEMLLERAEQLPEHAPAAHLAHGKLLVSHGNYGTALEHLEQARGETPSPSLEEYIEAVRELAP